MDYVTAAPSVCEFAYTVPSHLRFWLAFPMWAAGPHSLSVFFSWMVQLGPLAESGDNSKQIRGSLEAAILLAKK